VRVDQFEVVIANELAREHGARAGLLFVGRTCEGDKLAHTVEDFHLWPSTALRSKSRSASRIRTHVVFVALLSARDL
jgi:hypothetical protein